MARIPPAHRLRAFAALSTTLYTISLLATSSAIRSALARIFSPSSHPYKFAALVVAVALNLKTTPLAWHLRIFGTMIYQLYMQPKPLPPRALFRPVVTTGCFTSLLECDYNLHKSNSTYFADLDVGRSALLCALLRNGIRQRAPKIPRSGATAGSGRNPTAVAATATSGANGSILKPSDEAQRAPSQVREDVSPPQPQHNLPSPSQAPSDTVAPSDQTPITSAIPPTPTPTLDALNKSTAPFSMALGGVCTHFKRELAPYQPFEIWTRVLSWDRKWVYLVSHVVRAGAVPPDDVGMFAMQEWRVGAGNMRRRTATGLFGLFGDLVARTVKGERKGGPAAPGAEQAERRAAWQSAIYASSVARYVVKKGRITVPMEEVLVRNGLIPPRPVEGHSEDTEKGEVGCATSDAGDDWTWENIEAERLRGYKLAGQFGALDALVEEFPCLPDESAVSDNVPIEGGKNAAGVVLLGAYPDLVW